MTQKEQLWEKYEDAVFAILMDAVAEQEGKRGLQLMEELEHDPSAQVPEEVQRKAEKTIRKAFAAKNRESMKHFTFKVAQRIAIAVFAAAVLAAGTFAAFPEVRANLYNLIIREYEDHTEFNDALIYKTYQNKNKADVSITKSIMSGGPLLVDSENAIKTKITIQKHEATLIEKEAWRCLVIPMPKDDKIVYFESNGVSSADVIKIAENLPL